MPDTTSAGVAQSSELGAVARGVMLLRLGSIALSVPTFALTNDEDLLLSLVVLGLVLAGSLTPLLLWNRLKHALLRHPLFLGADIGLTVAFLAIAGTAAPYVVATLATAFLAGLLYRWGGAVVAAILLGSVYTVISRAQLPAEVAFGEDPWFVIAALYPLVAAAGVGLAGLLDRLEASRRSEARAAEAMAAAQQRARLARDLHDSVGKTLHGIVLTAQAIGKATDGEVAAGVSAIERGARVAVGEARQLISDLRSTTPEQNLETALAPVLTAWDATNEVCLHVDLQPLPSLHGEVAAEVVAVVGEALENVSRHAQADEVWVRMWQDDGRLHVCVRDDGIGIAPGRLASSVAEGHFGLVGIRERIASVDGEFSLDTDAEQGTEVRVSVPIAEMAATPSEVST